MTQNLMTYPHRYARAFMLAAFFAIMAGCNSGPDYAETMQSIEQVEVILKQAERDGLPETIKLSAQSLDSLYAAYVSAWPDSSRAPQFLYNRANMLAEYSQDYESCIAILDTLTSRYPDSEFAERARFLKGYTLANHVGDTTRARAAYEDFLSKHPQSELVPSVEFEIRTLGKSMDQLDSLFLGN